MLRNIFLGLLALVIFLYGYSLAWSKASQFALRKFRQETKKFTEKFDIPIEYGKATFGFSGLLIQDLRVGKNSPLVMSQVKIQVDLFPWSEDFGKPSYLSIRNAKIKTPLSQISIQNIQKILEKSGSTSSFTSKGVTNNNQKFIDKIFAASPAKVLEIGSAGVVLLSDQGKQLLALKGLKFILDKKEKKLLFKIDRMRRAEGPLDGYLGGRLELNPRDGQKNYRFFLRRKAGPNTNKNLWSVAGFLAKDLSKWVFLTDIRALPTFFGNDLENLLGKTPQIALKARLEGTRDLETKSLAGKFSKSNSPKSPSSLDWLRSWNINISLHSTQTYLNSELLSSKPIGPIPFKLSAKARVDGANQKLDIFEGRIFLPSSLGEHDDGQDLEVQFHLEGLRYQNGENAAYRIKSAWNTPVTSCEKLIKAMPAELIPIPQEFKLEGNASFAFSSIYDSSKAHESEIELEKSTWDCRVAESPYDLSKESLKGPFEVHPRGNPREDAENVKNFVLRLSPDDPHFTPISQLPRSVVNAFVAAEDASFFSHSGIETQALFQAFKKNLSLGRVAVGGSTITMQTAKNLFLSHERTLSRKIQEIFLAWHLEKSLSKSRILEIYLNIIEFGPNIYGIGQASKHFFDKDPSQLTLLEASYLANTLPNPKLRYTSFCQGRLTTGMTNLVQSLLKRMQSLGHIEALEFQDSIHLGLRFNEETRSKDPECLERTAAGSTLSEERLKL